MHGSCTSIPQPKEQLPVDKKKTLECQPKLLPRDPLSILLVLPVGKGACRKKGRGTNRASPQARPQGTILFYAPMTVSTNSLHCVCPSFWAAGSWPTPGGPAAYTNRSHHLLIESKYSMQPYKVNIIITILQRRKLRIICLAGDGVRIWMSFLLILKHELFFFLHHTSLPLGSCISSYSSGQLWVLEEIVSFILKLGIFFKWNYIYMPNNLSSIP